MPDPKLRVISWHPVLTDHQAFTLQSIDQSAICDLSVFQMFNQYPDRVEQGWVNTFDATKLALNNIPRRGWFNFIIKTLLAEKSAVHLFNSPFENPKLIVALLIAVILNTKFCLVSEPFSPILSGYQNDKNRFLNIFKCKLRPFLYQLYGVLIRRQVMAVFAISPLAVFQYKMMGIDEHRIYPFGYFVPSTVDRNPVNNSKLSGALKLIYVGSLIERKGVDLIISAIKAINHDTSTHVVLDVFGPGDPTIFDFQSPYIHYKGVIPFGNTQKVVAQYDLLVVPSRYDGWGVVVNESLIAGVPVICSSQVGASSLIKRWSIGDVFTSESIDDLTLKLTDYISNPARLESEKLAIMECIHLLLPETAGNYILDVINYSINRDISRPENPWYD